MANSSHVTCVPPLSLVFQLLILTALITTLSVLNAICHRLPALCGQTGAIAQRAGWHGSPRRVNEGQRATPPSRPPPPGSRPPDTLFTPPQPSDRPPLKALRRLPASHYPIRLIWAEEFLKLMLISEDTAKWMRPFCFAFHFLFLPVEMWRAGMFRSASLSIRKKKTS